MRDDKAQPAATAGQSGSPILLRTHLHGLLVEFSFASRDLVFAHGIRAGDALETRSAKSAKRHWKIATRKY